MYVHIHVTDSFITATTFLDLNMSNFIDKTSNLIKFPLSMQHFIENLMQFIEF